MNFTAHTINWLHARRLAGGAADADEPIHQQLDELCAQLWGVDAAGLRAIQAAYRDLYAPAPENGQSSAGHVKEDAPEYRAQADGQEATP